MANEQEDYFPRLYSLTEYIGQKAVNDRTTHYSGFEIRTQRLKVIGLAFLPALFLSMICSLFMGINAVLVIPVVIAAITVLFDKNYQKGMKLKVYRQILDNRASKSVDFYMRGEKIDLDKTIAFSKVVKASKPVGTTANQEPVGVDVHDLFVPAGKNSKRKPTPTAKKSRKS